VAKPCAGLSPHKESAQDTQRLSMPMLEKGCSVTIPESMKEAAAFSSNSAQAISF